MYNLTIYNRRYLNAVIPWCFMRQLIIVTIFLLVTSIAFSQAGDFVVIKHKHQSVRTFFIGSLAQFQTNTGEWFNGRIVNIKNDSLFFREVIVRQVPTPWGVTRLDTMTTFTRKIHFSEIVAVPRKAQSFGYIKNGSLFMIGGGGFIGLNLINSIQQRYPPFGKDNLPNLLIAGGVFALGKTMQKLHRPFLTMGKKYKVVYIKA